MTKPAPDPSADPVRAAIDSTVMLVLARFFMPAVVGALGWFLSGVLADLKQDSRTMQMQLLHLTEQQAQASTVSSGVIARLDATVKQLDRLQVQVDGLAKHN